MSQSDDGTILPATHINPDARTIYPAAASPEGTIYPTAVPALTDTCPMCGRGRTGDGSDSGTLSGSSGSKAGGRIAGHFGPYELLGEVARGGMGIVYRARDTRVNHIVALKVITGGDVELFLREVRTVMTLDHPHILPIHDFGTIGGMSYFTMPLMSGSLQERLRMNPLPPKEAAALVKQVAEGVQYAHERGVIHRDIKPQNVLLSGTKEDRGARPLSLVPRLGDFGLARSKSDQQSLSGEHALGTPSYMPPEQTGKQRENIGPRSDVYGLGALLYAGLTGRPPFQAADELEVLRQVREQEPVAPRQLIPSLPIDLETICLKCLQKEPERRYGSARELADDLGRFERGEPVSARPLGKLERGWRWCKRNPTVASLLSLVLLLMALGTSVAWVLAVRADSARDASDRDAAEALWQKGEAVKAQKRAEDREKVARFEQQKAEFVAYSFRLREAQARLARGNPVQARAELLVCDPKLSGWEHDFLLRQTMKDLWSGGHRDMVLSVAFSPDGKRVVSGSMNNTLKVWNTVTGQETHSFKGHTKRVTSVAFSPDGKHIVSGSWDTTLKVWDAGTGQEVRTLKGHTREVTRVAFSPDGKRIVSASVDQTLKVWDAETGQVALTLKAHKHGVYGAAFSPDGKRIVSGSMDSTLKVWDAGTGQEDLTLRGHTQVVLSVAFSPDGKRIVSGSYDSTVKMWDAATGQAVLTLKEHTDGVQCVAFSPDGNRIVSGSVDKTLKVWDSETGQEVITLKGHTDAVCSWHSPRAAVASSREAGTGR